MYYILDINDYEFSVLCITNEEVFKYLKEDHIHVTEGNSITFTFENGDIRTIKTLKFFKKGFISLAVDNNFICKFWLKKGAVILTEPLSNNAGDIVGWKINEH